MGHEGGGITRFNGKSFERVTLPDSILGSNITSINEDAGKRLWITTELDGALMIKNPDEAVKDLHYEHFLKGKSLGDQVFNTLVTQSGDLYFITNVGIRKYNPSDNSFESYTPEGMFTFFSISAMFEDSRGNLWFGTNNGGLSKLDSRTNRFEFLDTRNGLASNWVTTITEDRKGNIWAGHWKNDQNNGGISRIDPSGNISVFNTSNGLHDDNIWCITEDSEGNMLIGTTEQGLDIFKGEAFTSYSTANGLNHNQVNDLTEDMNGDIWFGTNHGISVLSAGKSSSFRHFNQETRLISNQIRFFRNDRHGNIWIGTADQGILLYNAARKKFEAQLKINSYIPYSTISMGITALEIGSEGHLWIGTLDGLIEYDIEEGKYIATYTQGSGLAGNHITALYADKQGNLWIGSDKKKGLTRYSGGTFSIIARVGEISPTCFTEDKNGNLWIGTELRGALTLQKDTVKQTGVKEGLLSNLINLLVCDEKNNIYIGTNRGMNRLDQQTGKIHTYTRLTGFTGIETKNNAWAIDSRGYLWIGTANGAIRCNLDLLDQAIPVKPDILITEMQVKGIPVEMMPGRRFTSNENDVIFAYISVSMSNPEGISYEVRLDGLHDTWQNMKNENSIIFNKLPPGKYTFRVRARNDSGILSDVEGYNFRILAPFYRRGSFIIPAILIILVGVVFFIRLRERNLKIEKKILEERVEERTLALSVANHELSMKNKDILDSITYAKRIQLAILPSEIPFVNTLIVFKPKDIVSGDFYWMNVAGGKEFIAAVDCTGHGVPGAFMSFIGYTSLNKIINEKGIHKPSDILNGLNVEVATSLHQKGEDIVNDGMDIALVCYTPSTRLLEYAGAFNPLILIRKGELMEVKADRFAIGRSTGREKNFTNHEIVLEKGDQIYVYSDGYADQFGGPDGKKFKTSALKDLLIKCSRLDTEEQHKLLDSTFEAWKGSQEQIDDVLVIGRNF
jgi:ligand-binding sensor domain-containing protein/serine phosphatase RsbU (regulator of sigma subunit)